MHNVTGGAPFQTWKEAIPAMNLLKGPCFTVCLC